MKNNVQDYILFLKDIEAYKKNFQKRVNSISKRRNLTRKEDNCFKLFLKGVYDISKVNKYKINTKLLRILQDIKKYLNDIAKPYKDFKRVFDCKEDKYKEINRSF